MREMIDCLLAMLDGIGAVILLILIIATGGAILHHKMEEKGDK